jgi:probable phosphoglycerate mutase
MTTKHPTVTLVRHAQTEWSLVGKHTGRTDIPLTELGERDAVRLGQRLAGQDFDAVLTSPLQRARRTCELAGFSKEAVVDPDLVEWNYGDYEGLKTSEIRARLPGWNLFHDGCPGGETFAQITERADRVVARLRKINGDVLLFSSGHIIRVLTARWLGRPIEIGESLYLGAATVGVLGYDHDLSEPVIRLWNDDRHLVDVGNVSYLPGSTAR